MGNLSRAIFKVQLYSPESAVETDVMLISRNHTLHYKLLHSEAFAS
jgi:hypothetical protein